MRIVYVIYNHTNQCIKVGYTGNLNNRFSQIQLSTVDELTLLLTFNGGIEVETDTHFHLYEGKFHLSTCKATKESFISTTLVKKVNHYSKKVTYETLTYTQLANTRHST